MARKAAEPKQAENKAPSSEDDFTSDLIKSLNKEHGSRIAYNLAVDTSPTHVKRWISTGSKQMDLIISNRANGGLPEGRIMAQYFSHLKQSTCLMLARTCFCELAQNEFPATRAPL